MTSATKTFEAFGVEDKNDLDESQVLSLFLTSWQNFLVPWISFQFNSKLIQSFPFKTYIINCEHFHFLNVENIYVDF